MFYAELLPESVRMLKSKKIMFFEEGIEDKNDYSYIIHHPLGESLRVSMGRLQQIHPDSGSMQHRLSTRPGSSGAPMINKQHKVFAMHNGGDIDGSRNFATHIHPLISFIINNSFPLDFIISLDPSMILEKCEGIFYGCFLDFLNDYLRNTFDCSAFLS